MESWKAHRGSNTLPAFSASLQQIGLNLADWDEIAHALILSSREPTLELATSIAASFGPATVNPYYDERKRSHARR